MPRYSQVLLYKSGMRGGINHRGVLVIMMHVFLKMFSRYVLSLYHNVLDSRGTLILTV